MPTSADFVRAFQQLEPIHENHIAILRHHARGPGRTRTMTELATAAGYADYKPANLQYGLLASRVGAALGLPNTNLSLLVTFTGPDSHGNEHWELTLRPEVAEALAELGWD